MLEQAKDILSVDKTDLENLGEHGSYGVLDFFHNAFELLFPGIQAELRFPSKKYIITGHSLGGSMASLLALRMTQKYEVNIKNIKLNYRVSAKNIPPLIEK